VPEGEFDLPARELIYNQPVDKAVSRLDQAQLVVLEADIDCSNSTAPGFVRQVTLGRSLNVHIIYGKEDDVVDEDAVISLRAGDEVTVWTPLESPCPS
jgi:hypothetical protein